jgi:hypothetical protein
MRMPDLYSNRVIWADNTPSIFTGVFPFKVYVFPEDINGQNMLSLLALLGGREVNLKPT